MNMWMLRGLMSDRHISQRDLAKKLGVSVNTVNSRMTGKVPFRTSEIEAICEILDIRDSDMIQKIFLHNLSRNFRTTGGE